MEGIIYAQPVADVISAVITIFMALHLHIELKRQKLMHQLIKETA